eukprot:3954484-Amphidinium_carterae.1
MASSSERPTKRCRFSAKNVVFQSPRTQKRDGAGDGAVQVTVYDWGSASLVFPSCTAKLRQVQVQHRSHNGITYQPNKLAQTVLPKFQGGHTKKLDGLVEQQRIKLTNTGGKNESFDRDEIGLTPWRMR